MDDDMALDEEALGRLVALFYARVRADAVLAPIFDAAVHDWPAHLEKLTAFWSSVMLTSGRYKGNPVAAHLAHVGQITPALFQRWLALWQQATADTMPAAIATALQAKAARIAESLQLALFFKLPAGETPRVAQPARG
ncbi:MAG: preprotein translocase subunit TatC [Sphingomonas bacterium]|nr:preprotein translocase subunit TatC [Sphingomonas bacterium]